MSDDVLTRLSSALEGRYAVERKLGEGGMATVYLADDLKHERKVALKVLKPELAAVVGADRFLAEIKTTANLQHPHILGLHDSGEADGFLYYVMPYVDGESLRERLDRERQLPVEEAVRLTTDLAEALDYAHRQGVIHRDIKPANILMHEGRPLIADFGIALAVGAAGGRLTETGLSVGTPYYMSPEQATGDQQVGPATDIYALGCVLYEMLVGDPPYVGSTAQAVLGKIIQGETVSATAVRQSVPRHVDAAIRKALEKLPADRFAHAQELATALADPGFRHGVEPAGIGAGAGQWTSVAKVSSGLAIVFAAGFGWALARAAPEMPRPVERFAAPFLEGQAPLNALFASLALSPDGSILVYQAPNPEAEGVQLWARRWDDLEAVPLRGTEGAAQPVVSPDGNAVAFAQPDGVKTLSFDGGPIGTLISEEAQPVDWTEDGYVYVQVGPPGAPNRDLLRIPSAGGTPEVLFEGEGSSVLAFTDVLPGGRKALGRTGTLGGSEIVTVDLDSGRVDPLTPGLFARYVPSGHVVFLLWPDRSSGTPSFSLMAAPFDPEAGAMTGPAVPVVEGTQGYAISDSGKLFYRTAPLAARTRLREFVWASRSGDFTPVHPGWTFDEGNVNSGWSLSPDGTHLALRQRVDGQDDIWIKELDDGPLSRLTISEEEERFPRWTPDGQRVTFIRRTGAGWDIYSRNANGTGQAELVYSPERGAANAFFAPDGEWLIVRTITGSGQSTGRDIMAVRPGVDSVARPLLAEAYGEGAPALSPDGRWIAYNSDETGRYEVFVRPFPEVEGGKWQVSAQGGVAPLWAYSGRELFYRNANGDLVAAQVETDPSFRVVERRALFAIPSGMSVDEAGYISGLYDVTRDDQRFLFARAVVDETTQRVPASAPRTILVNNFDVILRERAGG